MKNKKKVAFAVLGVFFLIIISISVYNAPRNAPNKITENMSGQGEKKNQVQEELLGEAFQKAEKLDQDDNESAEKSQEDEISKEITEDDRKEDLDFSTEEVNRYIDADTLKENTEEASNAQTKEEIIFPYTIPNTNLVVNKISDYQGIYIEDGADKDIQSVCAMLITNVGNTTIEYAEITVNNTSEQWMFKISTLPSKGSVVVQEANAAIYQETQILSFEADCAEIDSLEMSAEQIKVEEMGNQCLRITNLTDQDIPCVRVFYKFYMSEEDVYIGGITYVSKAIDLKANASCEVNAKHYIEGNSKIMMVKVYDTF